VTAVEGEWLAEMGPMFFTVKESYKTRLLHGAKKKQEKLDMEREMADKELEREKLRGTGTAMPTASVRRGVATPGLKSKSTHSVHGSMRGGVSVSGRASYTPLRVGL
jgi:pre-mRNA-splicing factor ATP-dependent RNA helicase DHX38/PRP16